ncbi:MAG: hypothetical protein ACOCV8_02455 [Spirochaetota bacterium]
MGMDKEKIGKRYSEYKKDIMLKLKLWLIIVMIITITVGVSFFIINSFFPVAPYIPIFILTLLVCTVLYYTLILPVHKILKELRIQYEENKALKSYGKFILINYSTIYKIPSRFYKILDDFFPDFVHSDRDIFSENKTGRDKEFAIRKERIFMIFRGMLGSLLIVVSLWVFLVVISDFLTSLLILVIFLPVLLRIIILITYYLKLKKEYKTNINMNADREFFQKFMKYE